MSARSLAEECAHEGFELAKELLKHAPAPSPATRALFTAVFAAGYLGAMKGMDRARFIESCEDAYDMFARSAHVQAYRKQAGE